MSVVTVDPERGIQALFLWLLSFCARQKESDSPAGRNPAHPRQAEEEKPTRAQREKKQRKRNAQQAEP